MKERNMLLRRYVLDGEATTAGFRVAWYDWSRRVGVAFPIGIHWIASWLHRLWVWTYKRTKPDDWEIACRQIREQVREEFKARIERDANDYDRSVKEYELIARVTREARLIQMSPHSIIVIRQPVICPDSRHNFMTQFATELQIWCERQDMDLLCILLDEDTKLEFFSEAEMNAAGWYRKNPPREPSNA